MLGLLLIKLIFLLFSIGGIALVIAFLVGLVKAVFAVFVSGIPIGNEQTLKIPFSIKKKTGQICVGRFIIRVV